MPEYAKAGERSFKGIPVSAGVCRGRIVVLRNNKPTIPHYSIPEHEVDKELHRLERALAETRAEVLDVQRQVQEGVGAEHASIFDAHLLVIEDPLLIEEVTRAIQTKKVNAEHAFAEFAQKYAATLSKIDDDYLRERVADVRDVAERILNNLMGVDGVDFRKLREPAIIIAEDLVPSQTALLDRRLVLGFATDGGSKTSHTAIMARSMQIPAVVGLHDI
ncbi:MAG: phosphoenolpyruvate-utilizing N-terminal domain-containing protein, partial [Limisphaerales bacterium]